RLHARLDRIRGKSSTLAHIGRQALFFFSLPNLGGNSDIQKYTDQPVYQKPFSAEEVLAPRRFLDSPVYPGNSQIPYSASWIPFTWESQDQRIWWAPNTDGEVSDIIQISARVNGIKPAELRGFATESDLRQAYAKAPPASFLAGIVFDPIARPTNIRYKILVNGTYAPNTETEKQIVKPDDTSHALILDYGKYIDTGFVAIQNMIDNAILRRFTTNSTSVKISPLGAVQSFPRPTVQAAEAEWVFKWLPGWCVNISILFWFTAIVTKMVYDKEYEYYRYFLILKVSKLSYWSHWVALYSAISVIISLAFTGVLYLDRVLVLSSWTLIWVHYLIFLWQLVVVAIVAAALTRSVQSAGTVGLSCTFIISAVYIALILGGGVQHLSALKTALSMIPWFASMRGGELMAEFDLRGQKIGLTWSNAWANEFAYLLIAQACGIILFLLISVRLLSSRRLLRRKPIHAGEADGSLTGTGAPPVLEEASLKSPAIRINSLTKRFRRNDKSILTAVNHLSFEVDRGEILGLLGHNVAGKTTLIRMLCGEFVPDSGSVEFVGADGGVDADPTLGVCLQQDILFSELSARDHLQIFAGLRGSTVPDDAQVRDMMSSVGLDNTGLDERVSTYSGGMQRKLSLAISLLGNPDYLLLDEPSAGMDPYSRRSLWDVVLRLAHTEGKTIIMTTHFMDEADMLSDRIAIMGEGRLLACGTSLFLKHNIDRLAPAGNTSFTPGYTITATCASKEVKNEAMRKIRTIIPDVESANVNKEEEISINLPMGSEELYASVLDVVNATEAPDVAIGLTSLEDVFLATSHEEEENDDAVAPGDLATVARAFAPPDVRGIWSAPVDDKDPSRPQADLGSIFYLARLAATVDFRVGRVFIFTSVLPIVFIIVGFLLSYLLESQGSLVSPPSLSLLPSTVTLGSESPAYLEGAAFNSAALGWPLKLTNSLPSGGELLARYEPNATLQYDSSIVSSLPLAISAVTNSTLYASNPSAPPISVAVTNAPLPYVKGYLVDITQLLVPMLTMLGFVPFAYVVIPIVFWRADHITTQLKFMGMSVRQQYLAFFVQRFLFGFIPSFAVLLIAAGGFGSDLLGSGGRWLAYILLVITTFLALIPFAMTLAPLFKSGRQVADSFPLMWNCLSIIPYIIVWLMTGNSSESVRRAGEIIGDVMTLIPTLSYQRGAQKLLSLQFVVDRASRSEGTPVEWSDTFDPNNGVLTPILVNVGVIIITTAIVWYQTRDKMSREMRKYNNFNYNDATSDKAPVAEDLMEEAVRADTILEGISVRTMLLRGLANLYNCKVQNLTKIYPGKEKAAVKGLNIGVAPSEVLVLLGPNGAGKTTTMRMLTGEEIPTNGVIKLGDVEDFELAQSGRLDFNNLYTKQTCGYCPQADALFPELTVKEHLELASVLKGLKIRSSQRDHVDSIASGLGLGQHVNTRSGRLSGGNRRKLSLGLAIIGNPRVLFLDEVTTGMDPAARRLVWAALRDGEDDDRPAMLMSTHYMDEATALSTRIGIMINGEMRVVGGYCHQRLFRFSRAISIEASLAKGYSASNLADALGHALGVADVTVVEDFNGLVNLKVPLCNNWTPTQQIAEVFRIMEGSLKRACGVIYYNISLQDLEQIFIQLKSYTAAEVATHNAEGDCWVIIGDEVYDVTEFLPDHPGGKKAILLFAGKDATEEFDMLHERRVIKKYAPKAHKGKLAK
ncbi:hypothetical protein FOZ63_030957, partial [Perkinsus olseni]